MRMEDVPANSPADRTLFPSAVAWVCLAVNTDVHDMIATDGTDLNFDIPGPERDSAPFLHLKTLGTSLWDDVYLHLTLHRLEHSAQVKLTWYECNPSSCSLTERPPSAGQASARALQMGRG